MQEIRNLVDITRVPFAASYIKGVINLRGSVLPVIDLKSRLGLEQMPYTENTRIVTVMVGLVDTKKAINEKDISKFLSGIGNIDGRLVIMLNLEEIVGVSG